MIIVLSLSSCSKDKLETVESKIQIRINNATALSLANTKIIDEKYGSVSPLQTTGYKEFSNTMYVAPAISFDYNGEVIDHTILICGTPMPPLLQNGKYTYTITFNDSTQSFEFNFSKN